MHPSIETFLASIRSLHQLDPHNLPKELVIILVKMTPEELFKTCTQLVILQNNIPSKGKAVTLSEEEITQLAQDYLKGIIERLKSGI